MELSTKKSVSPVQSELEKTRDTLRRTQKYLALARKDLIDLGVDVEVYKREGWVSTRARKRRERRQKLLEKEAAEDEIRAAERRRLRGELKKLGEWVTPSPTASEAERNEQNKLISDQLRLASYKDRVRRSSAQLLIASAVGYQYRETTVAMKSGKLVDGADPAIPRRYRAFENRRTSSLSSTEYTARAFKNWINREKDLRGRSRSRSPSTIGPRSRSSSTTTTSSSGTSITDFYIDTLFGAPSSDSPSDYGINTLYDTSSISDYGLDNLYPAPSTGNASNPDNGPSSGSSSSSDDGPNNPYDSPGSNSSSDESFDWMIGEHETFDPDEFNSNTLIVAQAMMAQATSLPGPGSWMSKIASLSGMKKSKSPVSKISKAKIPLPSEKFQEKFAALFKDLCPPPECDSCDDKTGPSSKPPNKPPRDHPAIYNPKFWNLLGSSNDGMLIDEVLGRGPFSPLGADQRPPHAETGWLTWKEAEEKYPTLDKTLYLHKLERNAPEGKKGGVWNAIERVRRESKLPVTQRKPLPLDSTTLLALQNLPLSKDTQMYSTVPLALPNKASDDLMKLPGPSATQMPLVGPNGTTPIGPPPMPQPAPVPQKTVPTTTAQKMTIASQHKFPASSPTVTTFSQAKAQAQNQNQTSKKVPLLASGVPPINLFNIPPKKSQASSAQLSGIRTGKKLAGNEVPAGPNVYAHSTSSESSSTLGEPAVDILSTDSDSAPSVVTIEDMASDSTDTDRDYHVTTPGFQSTFPSEEDPVSATSNRRKRSTPYPILSGSPSNKKSRRTTAGTFYSSSTSSDSEKENYTSTLSSTPTTIPHALTTPSTSTSTPQPRPQFQPPGGSDTGMEIGEGEVEAEEIEAAGEEELFSAAASAQLMREDREARARTQAVAKAQENTVGGIRKPAVGTGGHRRTKSVRFELETGGPNETMREEARRALNRYATTTGRRRGNLLR